MCGGQVEQIWISSISILLPALTVVACRLDLPTAIPNLIEDAAGSVGSGLHAVQGCCRRI